MKRLTAPLFLLAGLLPVVLGACKDKSVSPPAARIESAGEAMRNDNRDIAKRLAEQKAAVDTAGEQQRASSERQQFVDSLAAVGKRWLDVSAEAERTVRGELDPVIKKLDAVKSEADGVAVNECTGAARTVLSASMGATIAAYSQFRKETGKAEAAQKKLDEAITQFDEYEKQLARCR